MSMSVGSFGMTQEILLINERMAKLSKSIEATDDKIAKTYDKIAKTDEKIAKTDEKIAKTVLKIVELKDNVTDLENNVNLLSKSVNTCVSDVHELKHDVIKGTLLTVGVVSFCSMPILGTSAVIINSVYSTAAITAGTVMSSAAVNAVGLTWLGAMGGAAIFTPVAIALWGTWREDAITNKLKSLDPTITYKQANDMCWLVMVLQNKHPDPGHYETRHRWRRESNGDLVYEEYQEFVKEENEMEPCAKFLLEKYQFEVAKDRMPSFETILKRLNKSIDNLESKLII